MNLYLALVRYRWELISVAVILSFLFYGFQAYTVNESVMSLNSEQIEDCTFLKCETTIFGGLSCEPEAVPPRLQNNSVIGITGGTQ